jgi:protein TonB
MLARDRLREEGMNHAVFARASSLGASALLMGGAVLFALTMTYTVQEMIASTGPEPIEVAVEPPPPPPAPTPTSQPQAQPIAGPVELTDLPPIAMDPTSEPVAFSGPAAPAGPAEIMSPRWQERPRNLQRFYPQRALERGVEGEVMLNCLVRVSGLLACTIVSESPRGWGFADAAQRIAAAHRMMPATRDGVAVEGRYAMRVPFQID